MSKLIQKIILCLLFAFCCRSGYSQQTEKKMVAGDTISRSDQDIRSQKMLENYVHLLSEVSRKDKAHESYALILPVVGIHPSQLSYGVMAGYVRRTGGYVKFRHSFSKASDDGEVCDDAGIVSSTGESRWYSGRTEKSRLALTAGVLQRLWRPVYLYAGLGYGTRVQSWETVGGEWIKNRDHSFTGVEAELGGIARMGCLAVSVGVQTNRFKYVEANVSIGVAF